MDGETLHYLDGILVNEPMGWADFTEELDRDIRERLISVKYSASLTFTDGAYEYLASVYAQRGYCHKVQYEAKQRCNGQLRTAAKGVLILADAEWNLTRCEAAVPVVDEGIGAVIISNRDIPISPTAEASKNGTAISPVPAVTLSIHDPQGDGTTLLPDTRRTWDWFEAITHAVAYMSDDTITIASDWYAGLDDAEKWALVDGLELRTHTGASTRVVWTFKQLFDEMAGRYNLWMWATVDGNGNPQLRIEPESYFYGAAGGIFQLDLQDVVRTVDSDRLYAKVNVGCDSYIRQFTNTPLALPYVPLTTHGKEEYHFTGVCNTSETLDLAFDFITDSNAIEDVVLNANEEYDEDIFLLQYYDGPLTPGPETSRWQFSPDGVLFVWPFNQAGLNSNILSRYYLPSSVGANFGPQTAYSETTAAATANDNLTAVNSTTTAAVLFATPYTAAASEYAYFELIVPWQVVSNTPQLVAGSPLYLAGDFRIIVERFDAGNNLLQTLTFDANETAIAIGVRDFTASFGFSMNVGDYVQVSYQFRTLVGLFNGSGGAPATFDIVFNVPAGANIEKTFSDGGGFATGIGTGPVLKYTFERHIDLASWLSLTGNPPEALTISPSSVPLTTGWVANAKRNAQTGATQWEVIANP